MFAANRNETGRADLFRLGVTGGGHEMRGHQENPQFRPGLKIRDMKISGIGFQSKIGSDRVFGQ
jgi:hypothetical protein